MLFKALDAAEIDARSNLEFSATWAQQRISGHPSADGLEDDDELRCQYLAKVLADGLWRPD
ncbi:hypothetical protein [Enteractinococcus helveticum]|uniref:Uncharacterized protein n=1 Tax=Enteractinococcus helveticum TaxID=1837282 RepID=A0A1B7M1F1_9MICC|nr:hypothetical protein [Enteractinococcus helveticum]OAV62369.1 hypothetical protein A6F49_06570 [Enteractinococcus helveticum]